MSIPEQPNGSRPNADESIPPGEPAAGADTTDAAEPAPVQAQVVVRRSPRYNHFMLFGAIIGAVVALILTFAFPPNGTYDRAQVFGYLVLVGVALGVGLGALVALMLDRIVGRRGKSVIADWVETTEAPESLETRATPTDGAEATDTDPRQGGDA